ncbi:cyclic 2,3-diphosphoglycerate synthase [Candidatus Methanocrinis natronophilus]|uniref:Cyclic 2,3-diphosphoglycerate synthase n=1 Tax=Candidatus Methanocrinis natronophilus TaxID=3033396 RepID=A0ABT5X628_9EURY|nr:cyclic 2,3-diphosphoglycerate synthase [Candidatus Methanocrinis natronophilus]MDF0590144.1 cyclic 2,3-diphosphoglycerate synthase [Candidatus Methanocrinis natronophilus]
MTDRERVLILGAAGRDFHNFNLSFREDERCEVVGFTAAQIPGIYCRTYPPELAGPLYPAGLPIWPEEELEEVIKGEMVERCILAYSDLSSQEVMDLASRVLASGADFCLLSPDHTMLNSRLPVIAVCAVRTGAGKSPAARYITRLVRASGLRPVVVRHPMPYGDLLLERAQRFSSLEDLDRAGVTMEEREEYEAHLKEGTVVLAGVDYEEVLTMAEEEGDLIIWDGGNNDLPFLRPDLWITVADGLRPGHELTYYPGQVNLRRAQIVVISKAATAATRDVAAIKENVRRTNPGAKTVLTSSQVRVDRPDMVAGERVLVVEDGPSLSHGGMSHGAGLEAAWRYGAAEVLDPRPYASGSFTEVFAEYPHIGPVLPAMGYYPDQMADLEETVNRVPADLVLVSTPVDLAAQITINKPVVRVTYEMTEMEEPGLRGLVERFLSSLAGGRSPSHPSGRRTLQEG